MCPPNQPSTIEILARGLMQVGSKVLLCRNQKKGYRFLPGGHVDPGELASEACAREFMEETGMEVRVGRCALACEVLFDQNGKPRHEIDLVFHVEHARRSGLTDQDVIDQTESLEPNLAFEWVDLAAIPDLDVRPEVIRAWLASAGAVESEDRPPWISSVEGSAQSSR